MATITGLTKARMLEIEAASIVDGEVIGGNLILTKHDGTTINAGPVVGPQGPAGPTGPAGFSAIPGEIRLWSGAALPNPASYGKWVWADGAVYVVATYPQAAANISPAWKTFAGASDPGAANFRVPDLRGLVPAGMDAMPGGARANRMARAVAITLAAKTGEETHVITIPEMASHAHGITQTPHSHGIPVQGNVGGVNGMQNGSFVGYNDSQGANANISLQNTGNDVGHENVQPTVMIPYIVKLDG
jgi:microcystin-dependent protein